MQIKNNFNNKIKNDQIPKTMRADSIKTPLRYQKGELIRGEVVSRTQNKLVLLLDNKDHVEARLEGEMAFSRGEIVELLVSDSSLDQLVLKALSNKNHLTDVDLDSLLLKLGLMKNAANREILSSLMKAKLPVNKDIISLLSRMQAKFPDLNPKAFIFLMKNDIELSETNIKQILNADNPNFSLGKLINSFNEKVSQLSDRNQGLDIGQAVLIDNDEASGILARLRGLFVKLTDSARQAFDLSKTPIKTYSNEEEVLQLLSDTKKLAQAQKLNEISASSTPVDLQKQEMNFDNYENFKNVFIRNNQEVSKGQAEDIALLRLGAKDFQSLFDDLESINLPKDIEEATKKLFTAKIIKDVLDKELMPSKEIASAPQEINSYYEKIYKKLLNVLKLNFKNPSIEIQDIMAQAKNMKETVEFMNKFTDDHQYLQIPFIVNNKTLNSDLFIIKNKESSLQKTSKDDVSVLIQLNLASLGHLDIYVKKNNNDLQIEFFTQDDEKTKLIKLESVKLQEKLLDLNYNVLSIYTKTKEKVDKGFSEFLANALDDDGGRFTFEAKA